MDAPRPEPFVHPIVVSWADCDPARIAYSARIPAFALAAIEAWWRRRMGEDWFQMAVDHKRGMPFVHMALDFRAPITPRHVLDNEVRLLAFGGSSARFSVVGRQDGRLCYEGDFVEAFVLLEPFRGAPLPAEWRGKFAELVEPASA